MTVSYDEARWIPGVTDGEDVGPELPAGDYAAQSPVYTEGLVGEVASGDMRRALNVIRNRIAEELYIAEGKDVAQLSLALVKVLDAIQKVPVPNAADPVNEIAARRERRRAEAQERRAAGQ